MVIHGQDYHHEGFESWHSVLDTTAHAGLDNLERPDLRYNNNVLRHLAPTVSREFLMSFHARMLVFGLMPPGGEIGSLIASKPLDDQDPSSHSSQAGIWAHPRKRGRKEGDAAPPVPHHLLMSRECVASWRIN